MKFAEWKKDLEDRLQRHLEGAEGTPVSLTTYQEALTETKNVDVLESMTSPGSWVVYANRKLLQIFHGPLAHREASKFASDLLNGSL